jgi:hypothetical protein
MLSAMAMNAAKLTVGSRDSVANSQMMMKSLKTAASRVILTTGFMCEALSVAGRIAFRFNDLNSESISDGAGLVDLLANVPVDGGAVPVACATSAVTVIGSIVKALAQNQSMANPAGQLLFMQTLDLSFKNFLRRMLQGTVAGERRSAVLSSASAISVWRVNVPENLNIIQFELPPLSGVHSLPSVRFQVPSVGSSQNDITTKRVIDIALQYHLLAPAAFSNTIVSGLFGVGIFRESTLTSVSSLDHPALISIPVNVAHSSEAADFSCLVWNHSFYSDNACNLHSLTLDSSSAVTAVICECTTLALHAVSIRTYNSSVGSETEYVQGTTVINISDKVNTDWPSGRPRSPLKKEGRPESTLISDDIDSSNEVIGQDPNLQMTPLSAYLAAGIGVVGIVAMCSLLYQIQFYWRRQAYTSEKLTDSIMLTRKDNLQIRGTLEQTTANDSAAADVESFLCFNFDQIKSNSWNGQIPKNTTSDFVGIELRPPLPSDPSVAFQPTD